MLINVGAHMFGEYHPTKPGPFNCGNDLPQVPGEVQMYNIGLLSTEQTDQSGSFQWIDIRTQLKGKGAGVPLLSLLTYESIRMTDSKHTVASFLKFRGYDRHVHFGATPGH